MSFSQGFCRNWVNDDVDMLDDLISGICVIMYDQICEIYDDCVNGEKGGQGL